jgi:hypothetical protein
MANKFTRYLSEFGSGLIEGVTKPKGQLSNYRHATRLFVDNDLRLSPKTKFLFYVVFEMENSIRGMSPFTDKHANEAGLLVKSAELPKFSFDSVIKNQYNRKKILYKQINYEPVTIGMHDDSNAVVNAMWALYYGYYVGDRHNPDAAFSTNHLRKTSTNLDNFRYGLDNDRTEKNFFKSVTIYTMSRRRFVGYTLVNPKIKSWNHGAMDYSASEFNESQMTLEYEAVKYSTGNVAGPGNSLAEQLANNPKGFATLHYDNIPSPLSVAGGGVSTLTGQGGVLDGLEQIFGDIGSGAAFNTPGGFIGTIAKTINTYKNVKNLSKGQLAQEAINILSNPGNITAAAQRAGGVVGAIFPKSASTETDTAATEKRLTSPLRGR